jgi:hypothetical protein
MYVLAKRSPRYAGALTHCPDNDVVAKQVLMGDLCLNNAVNGTNIHTLIIVEVTFALNTFFSVDFENHVTFEYGLSGAHGFTGCARNAVI